MHQLDYKRINEKIQEISTTSSEVYEAVEKRASSDIYAPKELTLQETITYLYLGTMGQDLFYDETKKMRIPREINSITEMKAMFKMGAKQMHQQQVLKTAKNNLYSILEQLEKNNNAAFDFSSGNYSHTEVMATLHLAQTFGLQLTNWDNLNHNYCDVHTDWNCKFERGVSVNHEEMVKVVLNACVKKGLIDKETAKDLPLTDKDVLHKLNVENNFNL